MATILASAPSFEHADADGRLTIWTRGELAVTRIEGCFSSAIATAMMGHVEPVIRRSKAFVGLHDWTDAETFEVTVPARLAAWTVSLLPRIGRIVIATRHPLVSMAVRTTNLTIKRIEHLGSREAFVEAVRAST